MRVDRLASAQYNGLHGCGAQLNIRLEIVSCDSERFTAIAVTADLDIATMSSILHIVGVGSPTTIPIRGGKLPPLTIHAPLGFSR